MRTMMPLLVGLMLTGVAADAAPAKRKTARPAAAAAPVARAPIFPSADTRFVADWVATSGDNRKLPFAVIDKKAASLTLFDARGMPLAQVPVLIGIALGDDATPGVGAKKLEEIGPAEKTTPAGRYLAKFGYAAGRTSVLWVDYANSVAIHAIPSDAAKGEKRAARIASPDPAQHRITFGCINVPRAFYASVLSPKFRGKGGYVYVLPDVKPLEEVFPRLRVHALTAPPIAS